MKQSYRPSDEILAKYAELLVTFGLQTRAGKQLAKGSVVQFTVPEVAKPMYFHLQTAILKAGYNPLGVFVPSNDAEYNLSKNMFDNASKTQLEFYADKYHKGMIDQVDGTIYIIAETDPNALAEVDPKKIMTRGAAMKPAKDLRFKKIDAGKMSWTLGLYGTDASAKEAGMSPRAYWNQIINACYLDTKDPIKE